MIASPSRPDRAPFVIVCWSCNLCYGAAGPEVPCPICGDLAALPPTSSPPIVPRTVLALGNANGGELPKGFR